MHQIMKTILGNILTKSFFKTFFKIIFYIWKSYLNLWGHIYFKINFVKSLAKASVFFYLDLWNIKRFSLFDSLFGKYMYLFGYLCIGYLK